MTVPSFRPEFTPKSSCRPARLGVGFTHAYLSAVQGGRRLAAMGEYDLDWAGHVRLPGGADIEPDTWQRILRTRSVCRTLSRRRLRERNLHTLRATGYTRQQPSSIQHIRLLRLVRTLSVASRTYSQVGHVNSSPEGR